MPRNRPNKRDASGLPRALSPAFPPNPKYIPLCAAALNRDECTIELLLEHRADVNAMTRDGHTPMDTANTVYGRDPNLFEIMNLAGGKEGKVLRREPRP
jgi:ankyrin repeat protein